MEQAFTAINKYDFKGWSSLLTEDYESWDGSIKGHAAIEKFQSERKSQFKLLDEIGIIFVTPDVAIYKSRGERTGRADTDGKPLPTNQAIYARVLVKRNDTWLLAASFYQFVVE